MRTTLRFVTMLVLILIAGIPALAKGPTSATVTGPGIDDPIELFDYHTPFTDAHTALIRLTGLWYGNVGLEGTSELPPEVELGPAYTLTWLNEANPADPSDDYGIRQIIYPHAEGAPVIHTPKQPALDDGSLTLGWRTVPAELMDTLRQLGVPIDSVHVTPSRNQPTWPIVMVLGIAVIVLAAARLVNSRLRPVVSSK